MCCTCWDTQSRSDSRFSSEASSKREQQLDRLHCSKCRNPAVWSEKKLCLFFRHRLQSIEISSRSLKHKQPVICTVSLPVPEESIANFVWDEALPKLTNSPNFLTGRLANTTDSQDFTSNKKAEMKPSSLNIVVLQAIEMATQGFHESQSEQCCWVCGSYIDNSQCFTTVLVVHRTQLFLQKRGQTPCTGAKSKKNLASSVGATWCYVMSLISISCSSPEMISIPPCRPLPRLPFKPSDVIWLVSSRNLWRNRDFWAMITGQCCTYYRPQ